jgi:CRISPR type III-A-associated RAMP protein Csm4
MPAFEASATYYCEPRAPLRIGSHAEDLSRSQLLPSSDTLFGALAWAYAQLQGDAVAGFVDEFVRGEPPFLISSAMPATVDCRTLVPRPVRRWGLAPETLPDRKFLERTQYIDAALLPWLNGAEQRSLPTVTGGALVGTAWPAGRSWGTQSRPRVSVDRVSSASEIYASDASTFHETGFVIHVLARDAQVLQGLDVLLGVLAEAGIGGERSIGHGQFGFKRTESMVPLTETPRGLLLSMLWPTAANVRAGVLHAPDGHGYRLRDRMGWIASPDWATYRSRTVTMIAEGSHVNPTLHGPIGGMADVTPEVPLEGRHRVYRYGYGLFLDEGQA